MADFDIMNPEISRVQKGVEGKVILVYGSNSLGKTKVGASMPKPLVLPFESGLNAISGVPYFPVNSWSDFKKINKKLTNPRTLDKVKEKYQTIVFDEVEASAKYCQEYIVNKHQADDIRSGNEGFGLWKEYESEYWREINKLTGAGFTCYFIAHVQTIDDGKAYPKGDKRALAPVVDLADITIYLQSQGVDEEGKVIKSKAWFAETPEFFARSRFDYMDTSLSPFTAEGLQKVIKEGIEREEEASGIKGITFEEKKVINDTSLDYDELMEGIKQEYLRLDKENKLDQYVEVVEEHLGKDAVVSEATKKQAPILDVILSDLQDIE